MDSQWVLSFITRQAARSILKADLVFLNKQIYIAFESQTFGTQTISNQKHAIYSIILNTDFIV